MRCFSSPLSRGIRSRVHVYPIRNVNIDLLRPEGLLEALHGVAAVVHSAGLLREEAGQSFERAHVGATANLIEKLITEDDANFLLGPYSSGLTAGASAVAEQYNMIMIEGNGAAESLFERGFQNLFAVLTPASYYTQSAMKLLADEGAKTVVIAYEDTAFPTAVGEGAVRWAEEYGLEILAKETYPKDVADVTAIMTKFRDLDPDIFVGGGRSEEHTSELQSH